MLYFKIYYITVKKEKVIDGKDKRSLRSLREEKGLRAVMDDALLLLDRLAFVKYLE